MLPLSLYIHIPWCIRKCPYCDFNSHKSPEFIPEEDYIGALIDDLQQDLQLHPARTLGSIFIGGGTPSLFSANALARLLNAINLKLPFTHEIEITLEANPGTAEQSRFKDYHAIGINRLSLGIQSFNPSHLQKLGRIHDDQQAHIAIKSARNAGFDNINLDIMHSLPQQTLSEGMEDLSIALSYQPEHISWYQLTIEANTLFYKKPPLLPNEDEAFALETEGLQLLAQHNFKRYEISAFCQPDKYSRHNLNYWLFGDYLGIGAGAHGKFSDIDKMQVFRTRKQRQPKEYLNKNKKFLAEITQLETTSLIFEFMLNTTRLEQDIPYGLFSERTGLDFDYLKPGLLQAQKNGLIDNNDTHWRITELGRKFNNNLQEIFLT